MQQELYNFISRNELSPFNDSKSLVRTDKESIFKTRDAKLIHTKVLTKISSNFVFAETQSIWNALSFTNNFSDILRRQEFFKSLARRDNSFLKNLKKPKKTWKPRYEIIVVTEDESTFVQLQKMDCVSQLLVNQNDVADLERYDIVQVVDCEDFRLMLERLPQSIFIDSIENVYLERYLEEISGWRENFTILRKSDVSENIKKAIHQLEPLFNLLDNREGKIITEEEVEQVLEKINEKISAKVKDLTISGDGLMKMLGEGKMPPEILKIVTDAIEESKISEHIFNLQIPVSIDYKELEDQIKRLSANEFSDMAERVKRSSELLKKVPELLQELESLLLLEDFSLGIASWISSQKNSSYPFESENVHFSDASNMFLSNSQPISFQLDSFNRCSILTGANSGGKTTLLEHLLQIISLFQLGLPISGTVHLPIFTDIYYFAKTKGSASKGAFETLLSQMATIKPGSRTLILADEIEAVTEPGVAGKIISATAQYFIEKNCFMILATHLGGQIANNLPEKSRVDGIEAKGLDENFNLIVDHNPVLGRLAHSTPELIVERMAMSASKGKDYFEFLFRNMKK
ncbi:hypothetical protein HN604_00890 [archaeon]|mgnify:CR=1 FL=1|jgi:DNA mismatch repair protein MutS2|nr:hypothetical protein [archaeon]MBT6182706.1 hypothetical protein [archaeon]MBT6606697.1 hypothetical protein [archaeon]MBT7251940.1 hypothetical protein [archaeon]MBT7660619.1 hypothetical protein [archaeon]